MAKKSVRDVLKETDAELKVVAFVKRPKGLS